MMAESTPDERIAAALERIAKAIERQADVAELQVEMLGRLTYTPQRLANGEGPLPLALRVPTGG
jgi:hypothetical protein